MEHSGAQSRTTRSSKSKKAVEAAKHNYYILSNRKHFFLNHALIIAVQQGKANLYRLVVYHGKKILTDSLYPTLRGAKISFSKLYLDRAFNEHIGAEWSALEEGNIGLMKPALPPLPSWPLHQDLESESRK